MKLLVVDLYGDGDVLRVVEDTPKNREAILKWDEEWSSDFSTFAQENGIEELEFDILKLSPG
jgi:hypothetical protein